MPKNHDLMPWGSSPSSLFGRGGERFGFPIASLQEDMNRLFEQFYNGPQDYMTGWEAGTTPSVNVIEDEKSFKVEAALAGIEPKNVDVEVDNGYLTVKGEQQQEQKEEKKNYLRREISYGSFTRKVALPETADSGKAKATFKNGILTVEIPKVPDAQQKPKKIEIKTT
jgi:HSP20 family protein